MRKILLVGALFLFTQWTNAQNLLTNPGAESNYDGWIVTNGGSGWGIQGDAFTGTNCWASANRDCTLQQTIDLLSKGYTEAQLDAKPIISAGVYVKGNFIKKGVYSIKVELLDASGTVISTQDIANNATVLAGAPWALKFAYIQISNTGVRKVRFTIIGRQNDGMGWAGQYGPIFDNAFIEIANQLDLKTVSVSDIAVSSASITGLVRNPAGKATIVKVEYGTTESLGLIQTFSPVSGTDPNQISASLTGLSNSTSYFYRLVATDGTTTVNTDVLKFTTATPTINISTTAVTFSDNATVNVESNVPWTVTSDQPWLTVSPTSGTGNATLTLTGSDNNSVSQRSGNIIISSSYNVSKTVAVNQKGSNIQTTTSMVLEDDIAMAPVLDKTRSVLVTNSAIQYLRFIPTQSGDYTIQSESMDDPFAILFDENQEELEQCDDVDNIGNTLQFSIKRSLVEGSVYYLGVKNLTGDNREITLNITGGGLKCFTYSGTGNWNETSNWNWGILPGATNTVIINGNVTVNQSISVDSITIKPEFSLTDNGFILRSNVIILQADAYNKASLMTNRVGLKGTVQTFVLGNIWTLYSPVSTGETTASFLQNTDNAIASKESAYGMMDYNTTDNSWNNYFTTENADLLTAGKGYCLRRSADGIISSTGSIMSGNYSVTLSNAGEGWNCIGNPYPSALKMTDEADVDNNFLKANVSSLDKSYACMYIWDDASASYKIKGNVSFGSRDWGLSTFPSGQAFFVKAANDGAVVSFTPQMQTPHLAFVKKSAKVSWPAVGLTISNGEKSASTVVAFNEQMTNGLDVTYDAGLLRGSSGLTIYSRLVDDNGVDFAIQCLPTNYTSLVIPVGVETNKAGSFKFSLDVNSAPDNHEFILEDRKANVFTSMSNGKVYTATLEAGTQGVGRFFLHVKNGNITTNDVLIDANSISVYNINNTIYINGEVQNGSVAQLFNVNGKLVGIYTLQAGNNKITASLTNGIYVVTIRSNNQVVSKKLSILNQ